MVPVKDEADSVPLLAHEIEAALDGARLRWECLWVDDGSSDESLAALRELARRRPEHRWVALDRNYGQSAALSIGFARARADVLGMLDADLQNDPADFPLLYRRLLDSKAGMITGYRRTREDDWVRKLASRVANRIRAWLLDDGVRDVGCSVRVFRRACIEGVPVFRGLHRFLPALARMRGQTIEEHPVNHRPRVHGVTKYGIGNRLWVGIMDMLAMRWLQTRGVYPRVGAASDRA